MACVINAGLHICVSLCLLWVSSMTSANPVPPVPPVTTVSMDTPPDIPVLGTTTPAYYYGDYNLTPDFHLGTDFCEEKTMCSPDSVDSYPVKNCYCDSLCVAFGDCCHGNTHMDVLETPPRSQFSCSVINELMTHYGVHVFDRCAEDWPDDVTKSLCEERSSADDLLLHLPVSDNITEVLFRNMYCAFCNYKYDIVYWKSQIECRNVTDDVISGASTETLLDHDCQIQYLATTTARLCPTEQIVKNCPPNTPENVTNECRNGEFSLVYDNQTIYRNEHCALCNGALGDRLLCEPPEITNLYTPPPSIPRKAYSFRLLVDFNSVSGQLKNDIHETTVDFSNRCRDDEMFDPFANNCRKIFCIPPQKALGGRCVADEKILAMRSSHQKPHSPTTEPSSSFTTNCTYVRMNSNEFEFRNGTQMFLFSSRKLFDESDYFISGSDVFICSDLLPVCTSCTQDAMFQFDTIESYVSLVGLCLSLCGLFINFCVYLCFPQLRNTPGKILMSLIVALFLAQLLFLLSPLMENDDSACVASAVLVHYFFISAFCWMNVVALDLWITFSKQFISSGSNGKTGKRLWYYCTYGWLVPLAIVAVSVVVDNLSLEPRFQDIQPRYGNGVCWMTSRYGVIIFFACPLAVFKIFDIVAFVSTARHIYIANKHGEMARQNNQNNCTFFINLKLSLVMGLTWVFAFVANSVESPVLWYLFIIFNSLQGVFICISFICTKRVLRLLSNKLTRVSSYLARTRSADISAKSGKSELNATQLTALSSDKKD